MGGNSGWVERVCGGKGLVGIETSAKLAASAAQTVSWQGR